MDGLNTRTASAHRRQHYYLRPVLVALTMLLPLWGQPAAKAFLIIQTQTVPLTSTNFNINLPFQPFDPNLAPLASITLQVTSTISSEFSATAGVDPSAVDMTAQGLMTTTIPGNPAIVQNPTNTVLGQAVPLGTLPSPPNPFTFTTTLTANEFDDAILANTAPFLGGPININVDAQGLSTIVFVSGNGDDQVLTDAAFSVTLIYEYTPEPSSILLFALGLGGLGIRFWWTRRRLAA